LAVLGGNFKPPTTRRQRVGVAGAENEFLPPHMETPRPPKLGGFGENLAPGGGGGRSGVGPTWGKIWAPPWDEKKVEFGKPNETPARQFLRPKNKSRATAKGTWFPECFDMWGGGGTPCPKGGGLSKGGKPMGSPPHPQKEKEKTGGGKGFFPKKFLLFSTPQRGDFG